MSQASFQKRQREKARQDRALAKAGRRDERKRSRDDSTAEPSSTVDEDAVLRELAALHARFDAGEIEFDDFVELREEITQRLDIR